MIQSLRHTPIEKTMDERETDDREGTEPFLGAWDLVSYEHVLPSGAVTKPYGEFPSGAILYQADGRMSVHISIGQPARLASNDHLRASAEEAAQAWRTYFGYWGSFRVDAGKRTVVHRVEGSSFSNWIGTEQARQFSFDGNKRLMLETRSDAGHWRLVWLRKNN
jgi:hypothetical protein